VTVCAPPPIVFQRKRWSSDEVARLALAWRDALDEQLEPSDAPVATVLANHPEAVALFFALSCFPLPLIVMPPELRGWRSAPALPASTRLFLAPALRPLAPEAERLGLEVTVLSSPADSPRAREATFLTSPGVVLFYRARRMLLDGKTVSMMADGGSGTEAFRVPLPGGPAFIRSGWLTLRRQTGAPVLPVFTHLEGRAQIVRVHPPLPSGEPDPARDLEACRDVLERLLVDYLRRFPEQCYSLAFRPPEDAELLARERGA